MFSIDMRAAVVFEFITKADPRGSNFFGGGDCLTQSKAGFSRIGLIDLCSEICDLLFSAIPVITKYSDFLLNILNSWCLGAVLGKAEQLITGRIRKFGFLK